MTISRCIMNVGIALAFTHLLSGNAAADESADTAAPFEFSAQTLADLAECKAPHDVLAEVGGRLFASEAPPAFLKRVDAEGTALGLETFELDKPVTVFGEPATRISFLKEWVVVERPREAVLASIQSLGLKRAPIKVTEQYYRFIDPEAGPMLGAFAPVGDALAMMLGLATDVQKPTTLFIGCSYAMASEADFLEAANKADALAGQAGDDLKRMILEGK